MQCTYCSYRNSPQARFCQNCGKPLQVICPACSSANDPQARFCQNCGTGLFTPQIRPTGGAASNVHARLQQYIPKELLAKLEATRTGQTMGTERRIVTILFCDIEGSTALAESLDPEEWAEIMNDAFEFLITPVYRYEGMVARLMGDAILAFFGAPIAHEDDPQRAIFAALDIIEGARAYSDRLNRERGLTFNVRVGINTGLVTVGEVGTDLRVEYTAMGDAVNLAARLQSAARPMSALISDSTHRLIAPAFDWADLGTLEVKGKAVPVHVYEVLGRKAGPTSLRGLEGLTSDMVGREAELDALLQVYETIKAGVGRAVVIVGEPGLGKTRLISEWKTRVLSSAPEDSSDRSPGVGWAEGRCLSYGQELAYHLLLDLLRSLLEVPPSAGQAELRSSLSKLTNEFFSAPDSDVYTFLGHLLSVQLEPKALERISQLDPQVLQRHYLAAMEQLLRAISSRQPLVLVLEDIHWADSSSVELLVKLLNLIYDIPLLFCFITRPEREAPGWKLVAAARDIMGESLTELTLKPLSEADSRQLVRNLLEIESLPEHIRSLILAKAEGNPFFVEEVIRMLIDRSAIVKQDGAWAATREIAAVDIPDTLQGLLLARIDRLPEDTRYILRVASVIGRQFPSSVLERVLQDEGLSR